MKVMERYILQRALMIFAAALLWVLAIVWTTQILNRIDIVTGSGESVLTFLEIALLVLPSVIPVVAPFAVGIAVAQTLSTMNTDSELAVIGAAGSPRMTVIRPMLILAVAACAASFLINNFVEPVARERMRILIAESRTDLITTLIQEGSFQEIETGLFMQIGERLPDGRLGGIFVSDTRDEKVDLIYYAKSGVTAEVDDAQLLVMQDGVVHRMSAGGDVSIIRYASYALDLSQFMPPSAAPSLMPKDRTLGYLLNPDPEDKLYKSAPARFRAELHRRFSEWLYPLVFALIGLAVAGDQRSFREARIHPLLTTMAIALAVRWGGYFASGRVSTSSAFIPVVYAIPLIAIAITTWFIATGRMMELPLSATERIIALHGRNMGRINALKLKLLSRMGRAPGGAA